MIRFLQQHFLRITFLGILFMITDFGWSQSIWTNTIDDSTPYNHNPYTIGDVKAGNITVSGVGRGSGIAGNAGTGRYNAKGWTTDNNPDADDYFSFTITPNSGYKINFVGLDFTSQRSGTGPTNFTVKSSLDNYSAVIQTITLTGTSASANTVTLSGASFQNVAQAITFRIYGYGADGGAGTASINDFTFNGQVVNSLGIEKQEKSKISFYPNPVKDILNLVSEEAINSVNVYSLNGQLVLSHNSEYTIEKVDLSMLQNGLYLVRANTVSGNKTIYMIKD